MLHKSIRLMKTRHNVLLYISSIFRQTIFHVYFQAIYDYQQLPRLTTKCVEKIYICCMTKIQTFDTMKISSLFVSDAFSWPGTNIFYGHCKICYTQALKFYVPCNLNNIEKILLVILEMMDSA